MYPATEEEYDMMEGLIERPEDSESPAAAGSIAEDVFDNEFAKWIASEETQRRFHCGAFSEEQIAYSAARWARNFTLGKQ